MKSARKGSFIAIYPQVNGQTGRENNREFCGLIRVACEQIRVADPDFRDSCAGRNSSRLSSPTAVCAISRPRMGEAN